MAIRINERYFGFLGFLGFAGFTPGNSVYYMFFMLFFFFAFARPKTKEGVVLSDERWAANVTKSCRNAFFVFLIPSMLSIAFLKSTNVFMLATEVIPIAALLTFVASFVYYDWRGE
jgi:hypothetical protein